MKRTFHKDTGRVDRIEVPERMSGRRLAAALIFFAVGVIAIAYSVYRAGHQEPGWTEIKSENALGCAADFSFRCYVGGKDPDITAKVLTGIYTEACNRADWIYSARESGGESGGLHSINTHPNETVAVEPELYAALEQVQESGTRYIYMAPVYETYDGVFSCTEDYQTQDFDPLQNRELADEFRRTAAFASDPGSVDIRLLGDGQVRLEVSEEYAAYCREIGATAFLDFNWLRNAIILDNVADTLRTEGYTAGYIQSSDGFGVNLAGGFGPFELSICTREEGEIARIQYDEPLCFAAFRSYSTVDSERDYYYGLENGEFRAPYIDPADGMPKCALDDLLVLSDCESCLSMALAAGPAFISDGFDSGFLEKEGMTAVWCEGTELRWSGDMPGRLELAEGYTASEEK